MKANDKKAKENFSLAELAVELNQTQEKMFRLAFKHRVNKLANPLELRSMRRHVARLKTWMRQKSTVGLPARGAAAATGSRGS